MRIHTRVNGLLANSRCRISTWCGRQIPGVITDSRNPRVQVAGTDSAAGIGTKWTNTLYPPMGGENLHGMARLHKEGDVETSVVSLETCLNPTSSLSS